MIGNPVTINGREYLVRYPVGALIRLEKALGWSIIDIRKHELTMDDMAVIVRYGLHDENGNTISQQDFDAILDAVSVEEFAELFTTVSKSFGSKSAEGTDTKN